MVVPLVHGEPALDRTRRRRAILRRCLGHAGVLTMLLALLPFAIRDSEVRAQGLWYPVRRDMSRGALLYALMGKLYEIGMFSWAPFAIWRGARRLSHPLMRLSAWLGEAVALGMLTQTLVAAAAQWRGENFYASAAGEKTLALWRTVGTALPLGTLTLVGVVTRWRLFWLAHDLRAFVRYVLASIAEHQPDRLPEVVSWVERVMGERDFQDVLFSGQSSTESRQLEPTIMYRLPWLLGSHRPQWRNIWRAIRVPTANADQLTALLQDLLRTTYPAPGDAMLLAARWLGTLPSERAEQMSERDIAMLLLAAAVAGGQRGLFEPFPLPYPAPLEHISSQDRTWRTWGAPVAASFLRSVWRLIDGRADRTISQEVVRGFQRIRQLLRHATPEEREYLILSWLDDLEQWQHQSQQRAQMTEDPIHTDLPHAPGEAAAGDLEWWRPPTWETAQPV